MSVADTGMLIPHAARCCAQDYSRFVRRVFVDSRRARWRRHPAWTSILPGSSTKRRRARRDQTLQQRRTSSVKVCMFHLMPYRDLPADFGERYKSAYIDPLWFDVADAGKVGEYYNATLDELLHAANAGFHGVCTNQHHQNVYGFMANPR